MEKHVKQEQDFNVRVEIKEQELKVREVRVGRKEQELNQLLPSLRKRFNT